MANTNNTEKVSKVFKVVKPLENGYLVQEMILTQAWVNLVNDLETAWLSQDGICSILTPYDTVKKQTTTDKKYVANMAQYFKKEI